MPVPLVYSPMCIERGVYPVNLDLQIKQNIHEQFEYKKPLNIPVASIPKRQPLQSQI